MVDVNELISKVYVDFDKAVAHLKEEYGKLQIGRANPSLVEGIPVEVYGTSQPIKSIATISVPDPRTVQIQPWDRGNLVHIEKAIVGVGLGLNPLNDGTCIRLNIPPLTEERRTDLTKHVRKLAEDAKIVVRSSRQTAISSIKQLKVDSEITEDDFYSYEKDIQAKVDIATQKIDEISAAKEKDVMTV